MIDEESNYTIESQKCYSTNAGEITPSSVALKPTDKEEYTFEITLKAKEGYVFPANGAYFDGALKVNGNSCDDAEVTVTADGKTLTASLFVSTKVKGVSDIPDSGIIIDTTVNRHTTNGSVTGKISITKDHGYIIDLTGDTPKFSVTVWFKPDSDSTSLIQTENQDEAVMSVTVVPEENKAVMALMGDISKNASYSLNLSRNVYVGSTLTYGSTIRDENTEKIIMEETRNEYYVKFQIDCPVKLIVMPTEDINEVVIDDVKFNYVAGDAPKKAAAPVFADNVERYEIIYECWEELENDNPVAFWYSDESRYTSSMKRITRFEEGKNYRYSIRLRAKDGYDFAEMSCLLWQ